MHPQLPTPILESLKTSTRRRFLQHCGTGMGALALGSLLNPSLQAGAAESAPTFKAPHFAPKAKNIIYLFQSGGPSHLDLFDPKPELTKRNGQRVPEELVKNIRLAQIGKESKLLASPYQFARHGKSGAWISELLPQLGSIADDVCFVKGFYSEAFNHDPATLFMNTGAQLAGRPGMGSWFSYGLGSENKDLPAFVVYVGNPPGMDRKRRRQTLDVLRDLNQERYDILQDPEIQTRIASYELAYRMQTSVPEVMDISGEAPRVHEAYGTTPGRASFANNCLLARRLVERGVRFVQLYHRGWDHHGGPDGNLVFDLKKRCAETDQPSVALIKDLKERGLLDETLVLWGGEFGRTPMMQGALKPDQIGRDHHPHGYTIWMAGGGIKPGTVYGGTDDFGFYAVENKVHVHDLHATLLHLFGVDHHKLTYRFQGRDFRLTDVHGEVIQGILA